MITNRIALIALRLNLTASLLSVGGCTLVGRLLSHLEKMSSRGRRQCVCEGVATLSLFTDATR